MRVLFCHDGPLRKDDNNNYYGIAHNDETFKRYYSIGDELVVVMREKKISKDNSSDRLSRITVEPFRFVACPNTSSIKGQTENKKEAKSIITNEISKADYIVIRLPSFIGNMAVDVAEELHKPYLVEAVADPWDAFWNHSAKGKLIAPYMYFSTKRRIYHAPYVVYVTNSFLQNRYPTKGKHTNCSNVSLPYFEDGVLDKRVNKINSPKEKFVLGTTAAVNVRYKGQQYVIEALGKLKKQGITNIEYQLVGDGDQHYLKEIAKKHDVTNQVLFLGPLKHDDVFKWLDSIDLYIQPSRQEGLPRALIEAMSRALPAIGANTAGIPELLDIRFIFSNSRNNIKELCVIIKNLTEKTMLEQAERNYKESKKYNSNVIEKKRQSFFRKFKNQV